MNFYHMSTRCSFDVEEALKNMGFKGVKREQRNSFWHDEIADELRRWSLLGFRRGYSTALLWSGDASDLAAAKVLSDKKIDVLEEEYKAGGVPNFPHVVVIGRRSV
jgi:hypothetical protein